MKLQYEDFKRILSIGIGLSTEKNPNKLLEAILEKSMEITHCDAGTLYMLEDNHLNFSIMKTISMGVSRGVDGEPITDLPPVPMEEENVCAFSAIHRKIINIPDVYASGDFDFSGPEKYDALTGYHTKSMLVIPLENNDNELLGVMQLINAMDENGNIVAFDNSYDIIVHSLSSMAAIELTNLSHTRELKQQLRSFVEAFATAVDERTPYNGAHTRKVAEYSGILAEYMNKQHEAGLCEKYFDEEGKEKLLLAALLHDIGKIIIPLRIMNRATRLDNDFSQIENRFELLTSYYEIDMLRGRITENEYKQKTTELKSDLDFIRRIDKVDYLMDDDFSYVQQLAKKQYEKADGTIIPYLSKREADCLSIRKGTLTEEDRRQMESHTVMTEKILEKVHFHKNYAIVPKWASEHHEYLDGSGYPYHRKGDEIDLETRILTITDIYDAMTSTDRPYKEPMSSERAFAILKNMAEEGKLDGQLVGWFEEALKEEQR